MKTAIWSLSGKKALVTNATKGVRLAKALELMSVGHEFPIRFQEFQLRRGLGDGSESIDAF